MAELEILTTYRGEAADQVRQLNDEVQGLNESAGIAARGFNGLKAASTALLGAVSAGVFAAKAALIGFAEQGVKEFSRFEDAMNEVFTLLPTVSERTMGDMRQQVLDLSTEMGRLPNEVVPALYQALSAGVPQENVFEFLRASHQAALGGVSTLETAVDSISSVVNAYGTDVLSAAEASDLMFTAVKNGKTTFNELGASLFNVTPTAAGLGVAFGDVTAAMAQLTSAGVPTSVATTQLRALLQELGKEGTETSRIFQEMAGANFRTFIAEGGNVADALALMQQAADQNGLALSDMFGSVEAGNAALVLGGEGLQDYRDNIAAMQESSGATQAAYERMNQSMARTFEKLRAQGQKLLITFGENLAPTISRVAGKFLALAEQYGPRLIDFLTRLIGAFTTFFGGLLDGRSAVDGFAVLLGTLAELFGQSATRAETITAAVRTFLSRVREVTAPLAAAIGQFVEWKDVLLVLGGTVLYVVISAIGSLIAAAGPAIALFAGLVAVAAALRRAWETNFAGIRDVVARIWDSIKLMIEGIKKLFRGDFEGFIRDFGESFRMRIEAIAALFGNLWELAHPYLVDFFNGVIDWVNATDWAEVGQRLLDAIGAAFESIGKTIALLWELAAPALERFFQNVIDWVQSVDWAQVGRDILAFIVAGLENLAEFTGNLAQAWYRKIADWIAGVDWKQLGSDILKFIIEGMAAIGNFVGNLVASWLNAVSAQAQAVDWYQVGYDIVTAVVQGLKWLVEELPGILAAWFGAFVTWVAETDWQGLATQINRSISAGLAAFAAEVAGTLHDWWLAIKNWFLDQDWHQLADDAIQGIKNGLANAAESLGQAFSDLAQGAIDAIKQAWRSSSPARVFIPIGASVPQGLAAGIRGGAADANSAMRELAGGVQTAGVEALSTAVQAVAAAILPAMQAIFSIGGADLGSRHAVMGQIAAFADVVRVLVNQFAGAASAIKRASAGFGVMEAQEMADAANQVSEAVQQAIGALAALSGFAVPGDVAPRMAAFAAVVQAMLQALLEVARDMGGVAYTVIPDFAQAVQTVAEAVTPIVAGLQQLNQFEVVGDLADRMQAFADYTARLVKAFADAALQYPSVLLPAVIQFVNAAQAVAETVRPAIDAITAVTKIEWPGGDFAANLGGLNHLILVMIQHFEAAANGFSARVLTAVQRFTDAARSVFDVIQPGIGAVIAITEIEWPRGNFGANLGGLAHLVMVMVDRLVAIAGEFDSSVVTAAADFADSAQRLLALIQPAVDALTAVGAYTGDAGLFYAIDAFKTDLQMVTDTLLAALQGLILKWGTEVPGVMGEFASKVAGIFSAIQPAVDTLVALGDYASGASLFYSIDAFKNDFIMLTTTMLEVLEDLVGRWESEVLTKMEALAEVMGRVLGPIQPGIDALNALADYASEATLFYNIDAFRNDFVILTTSLISALEGLVDTWEQEVLAQAGRLADTMGQVLGPIQPGIDALNALAKYEPLLGLTAVVETFQAQLAAVAVALINAMQALRDRLGDSLDAAHEASGKINQIVSVVQPGIDALNALAGYAPVQGLAGRVTAFTAQLQAAAEILANRLIVIKEAVGDRVNPARKFAEALQGVFAHVSAAAETLVQIGKTPIPDMTDPMARLLAAAEMVTTALMGSNATLNGSVVDAANDFARNVKAVVDAVLIALADLQRLITADTPAGLQQILDAMEASLANMIGPVGAVGHEIGRAFAEALTDEFGRVLALLRQFVHAAVSRLMPLIDAAHHIGYQMMLGMARGVQAGQGAFVSAVRQAARAAVVAAEQELQIASPSRVFERIGMQSIEGFIRPFEQPRALVQRVRSMAQQAISGAEVAVTQNRYSGDVVVNNYVTVNVHGTGGGTDGMRPDIETAVERALARAGRKADAARRMRG